MNFSGLNGHWKEGDIDTSFLQKLMHLIMLFSISNRRFRFKKLTWCQFICSVGSCIRNCMQMQVEMDRAVIAATVIKIFML